MTCQRERKIEIAIPGMEKSLCSSHENKETDDNVLDFNFDYCENEIDENENSNDDEHEKNTIEMGIELGNEAESERDREILENEEGEELKQNNEDTFIKLGCDGRLRGRCGTPGKMKTKKAILLTVLIIRYIIM